MVFLSRYVVGGVARNVQGNEHLALLPIPFQLPVVGAQEKEGREAGVIAHRRAHPQRRPQQQRQEASPRGPATALHAAARSERRSLIQFWRRRDGEATRREGEKAAEGSGAERARERSPAGKFGGRPRLPKFLWAALERGRICGRRERVVQATARCSCHCLRATPLGQSWESARPAPHLLKAPGAESRPSRTAARVPAAPPPPSTAPRARARPPAPVLPSSLSRTSRGARRSLPELGSPPKGPLRGTSWRGPRVLSGGHGVRESLCGTSVPRRERTSCLALGRSKRSEPTIPFGPQIPLFS